MVEAGAPHRVRVFNQDQFSRIFFDFQSYRLAREGARFGSVVNPLDGTVDTKPYTHVKYVSTADQKEYDTASISKMLGDGRRIILLGEYGAGKSRCLREEFFCLAPRSR
jgi:hypothetical protein